MARNGAPSWGRHINSFLRHTVNTLSVKSYHAQKLFCKKRKQMHRIQTFNEEKKILHLQLCHFLLYSCRLTGAPVSAGWGCSPRARMPMWIRYVFRPWAVLDWQAWCENNISPPPIQPTARWIHQPQPEFSLGSGSDRRFILHHCQSEWLWWMKS